MENIEKRRFKLMELQIEREDLGKTLTISIFSDEDKDDD